MSDDALGMLQRRIIFLALICWLPLLLFSALQGQLTGGGVAVPFLHDVDVHVRFLVAIPLLIVAELVVHRRTHGLVNQFLERDLIAEQDRHRFHAAIVSAMRLRDSVLAELFLIAFVYVVGVLIIWRNFAALDTATWYAVPTEGGSKLSVAGMWFGYVSLPIFQFFLLRWYFRIFIWARFLWQVSRIDLCLIPTHPDRAGGLGFLSGTVYAFIPLLMAHGALLGGLIAGRIFHMGETLTDFKLEIIALIIFLLCLVQGPLLVFAPQLAQAKRTGKREYGTLAQNYVRQFDAKWLRGGAAADEPLLGSADIQSLGDLGNSFENIRSMGTSLISKEAVLLFAAAIVVPIVPLALTMMPLEELFTRLLGILF